MSSESRLKLYRVKHRAQLRAQDLRPIDIWVPDVRSPAFRSEAHRQSAAVAASAHARDDQASKWSQTGVMTEVHRLKRGDI